MNRTACGSLLLLVLVPTAAADHPEHPVEDLQGTYLRVFEAVPPVDLRPGIVNETLGPHTPEALHPVWDQLDGVIAPLYGHCGLGPLTEGEAGVRYDPTSRHLTVFVSYELLDPHLAPLWDLLGEAGTAPPVPVPLRDVGAGADVGICTKGGIAGGPIVASAPIVDDSGTFLASNPVLVEALGGTVLLDHRNGTVQASPPDGGIRA